MRPAVPLALLALAACGGRNDGAGTKVDANQLERLSRPKVEPQQDTQISARPQPLTGADLRGPGMSDPPRCDFSSDGHRLFASQGSSAIARIGNRLLRFAQPTPASASGTYVSEGEFSISIGRTDVIDPGGIGDDRRPARLTATNRRTRAQVQLTGTWRCGAV